MVPGARWLVVLAVAVGLVGAPVAVRAWPVADREVGAAELADLVRGATELAWSGEVRTQGSLEIPESDSSFDGVARLLGESSQLRVWWSSAERFRVDRVRESGETDTLRLGPMSLRWRYEGNQVTLTRWSGVRLPDDPDVVPAMLARRMLDDVPDDDLTRLPAERIAGRTALGLRLQPSDDRSTIDRVDLWADADSGLPLRVEVYAGRPVAGDDAPVLASEVERLELGRSGAGALRFSVPEGAEVGRGTDLAEAADRAASYRPPQRLAGLPRTDDEDGAAAVYGSGPTSLAVIPVSDRVADGLREQLGRLRSVRRDPIRVSAELGPLSVSVLGVADVSWLLVGTLTPGTVDRAGSDVVAAVRAGALA